MTSDNVWQPLIEGLIESVLIVDTANLHVVSVNSTACKLLGVEPDALIGRPVTELAATPEDMIFWDDVASGLSDEIFSETLLCRADGEVIKVDRRVSRVALNAKQTVYLLAISDRTQQRRVEDELELLVAELRATLESTADGMLVVDLSDAIRSYNRRFVDLWEIPRELMSRHDDSAIHDWLKQSVVDSEGYESRLQALMRSPLIDGSDLIILRSGRVLERVSLPQYARGRPIGRVFSFRDITARLADESRLRLASKVFSSSLDAIIVTDGDLRIVATNRKSQQQTGFTEGELIGRHIAEVLYRPDDDDCVEHLRPPLVENGYWEGDIWHRKKNGHGLPGFASVVRVLEDDQSSPQFIVFFKDITEKLAANKRIEELAYNDVLTGLPNRAALSERIEFALEWSRRENKNFAVLFLDLDRFKQINDSLGHAFGDRVLVCVAERIKGLLRSSDTAARLGGDEFLLLLHDAGREGAEQTANRIIAALSRPFVIDNMSFSVTSSIGIAIYPYDGETADDLVKNADTAMYRVKDRGRAGYCFYQREMNVDLLARMKLDQAMRNALSKGYFRLVYQPQVNLNDGRIVGAEALLRWNDPELGEIQPSEFIPIAEDSGLIVPIGDWVLTQAVKQAAHWHRGGLDIPVAVNVSALQFQKEDFVGSVSSALHEAGLPPRCLELELTESILIQDAEDAQHRLRALAELGVQLSIDDFGTGYSSLTYLKRFQIHKLKIDRSFIDGLPADDSDSAIATAIINLGRALKLAIIAEGVETESQRDFLAATGCDHFQGYLFAAAVPPESFETLFRQTNLLQIS